MGIVRDERRNERSAEKKRLYLRVGYYGCGLYYRLDGSTWPSSRPSTPHAGTDPYRDYIHGQEPRPRPPNPHKSRDTKSPQKRKDRNLSVVLITARISEGSLLPETKEVSCVSSLTGVPWQKGQQELSVKWFRVRKTLVPTSKVNETTLQNLWCILQVTRTTHPDPQRRRYLPPRHIGRNL